MQVYFRRIHGGEKKAQLVSRYAPKQSLTPERIAHPFFWSPLTITQSVASNARKVEDKMRSVGCRGCVDGEEACELVRLVKVNAARLNIRKPGQPSHPLATRES